MKVGPRFLSDLRVQEHWKVGCFLRRKRPAATWRPSIKAFQKARKAAGFPSAMVLYTARHGVDTDQAPIIGLKATMDVLGHADVKTAIRYQDPDVFELRAQLESGRTNGRVN